MKYFFSIRAVGVKGGYGPFSNVSTVTVGKRRENQPKFGSDASNYGNSCSGTDNRVLGRSDSKNSYQNLKNEGPEERVTINGRNGQPVESEIAKLSANFAENITLTSESFFGRSSSGPKNPFFRRPKKVSHRRFMRDLALSPHLQNGALVYVNLVQNYRILTVNAKEDEKAMVDSFQKIQKYASQGTVEIMNEGEV